MNTVRADRPLPSAAALALAAEHRADCNDRLLELPFASRDEPFGPEIWVYRIGGKIFAFVPVDGAPAVVTIKGPPEMNDQLSRTFTAITPGYHMNKRHWISVVLDGTIPDELLEELLAQSHGLVFASLPKRLREGLF
jgi:predicted DNA-binding protein (MmcQ/YjbR family)